MYTYKSTIHVTSMALYNRKNWLNQGLGNVKLSGDLKEE